MTFDPTQNRIRIDLMTEDELAALKAAKHGWEKVGLKCDWINMPYPVWLGDAIYRAKPAPAPTILRNGVEVPELVWETLEDGDVYWVVDLSRVALASEWIWNGHDIDYLWLSRGLIHRTKEAAQTHARAMIKGPSLAALQPKGGE